MNLAISAWTIFLRTGFQIRETDLVRRHSQTVDKYEVRGQDGLGPL